MHGRVFDRLVIDLAPFYLCAGQVPYVLTFLLLFPFFFFYLFFIFFIRGVDSYISLFGPPYSVYAGLVYLRPDGCPVVPAGVFVAPA